VLKDFVASKSALCPPAFFKSAQTLPAVDSSTGPCMLGLLLGRLAHRVPMSSSLLRLVAARRSSRFVTVNRMTSPGQPYAEVHQDPKGPGDARPTALRIIEDQQLMGKLSGRVFMVTGASSGLGIETVQALHAAGAHVIMPVRNVDKGEKVKKDIEASNSQYSNAGELKVKHLDLNSLASVRSFARQFLTSYKQLNCLICNAGEPPCAPAELVMISDRLSFAPRFECAPAGVRVALGQACALVNLRVSQGAAQSQSGGFCTLRTPQP
jgi:short chain dehydrogenase